ncbi:MAG: hypothetical protein WD688_19760 [Candidatus Binatia bacterium]
MSRADISPYLIHFTSGQSHADAFTRLRKIIADRKLIAGSRFIKGNYRCVCFSEAPLASLKGGLVNEDYYSRYSPFGIMVSKQWLFAQGGRPAIYQSDEEYHSLPESNRWRHVLYQPRNSKETVDFTWEREWRIKCDCLAFDQSSAKVIVLDRLWGDRLISEHDQEEDYRIMQYNLIFDDDIIAEAYRNSFQWTVLTLS